MNIILGRENAAMVGEKYTVLELDTLNIDPDQEPVTAYCLIETTNINDLVLLETLKQQHDQMMSDYKTRQWHQCQQAVESLRGCWSGQMDSFYDEMTARLSRFIESDPGQEWSPVLDKSMS